MSLDDKTENLLREEEEEELEIRKKPKIKRSFIKKLFEGKK